MNYLATGLLFTIIIGLLTVWRVLTVVGQCDLDDDRWDG
jgi:hypothetical protein